MTEMKLIPRKEVEEKYTWDMTLLYKTDEDFKASLENIKKEILDFKATYEGKLADHATLDTAIKSTKNFMKNTINYLTMLNYQWRWIDLMTM